MKQEKIIDALGDIGDDLLLMAHTRRFVSHWKRWLRTAACLALVICLTALALPYLPIGCGSSSKDSTETAMPPDMQQDATIEEAPAEAEPETEEETASGETAPEDSPEGAPADTEDTCPEEKIETSQALCQLVVQSTIYYLDESVVLPGETPSNIGEYIGDITSSDDTTLTGCKAYAMSGTVWFSNHAVDGQSVPAEIYVDSPDGWLFARTHNEKTVSRYTAGDIQAAVSSNDSEWLLTTFVEPLECRNISLTGATEDREILNALFLASLTMNTGTALESLWLQEDGSILVPSADVERRLAKFLDDFSYAPTQTAAWDASSDMLRFSSEELYPEVPQLTLEQSTVDSSQITFQVSHSDGSQRLYCLRFDADSWRYLEVTTIS